MANFFKKIKKTIGKPFKRISRSDWNPVSKITAKGYHSRRESEVKREAEGKQAEFDSQERSFQQKELEKKKKRQMEEADARRAGRRGLKGSRRSLLTGDDRGAVQGDTTG